MKTLNNVADRKVGFTFSILLSTYQKLVNYAEKENMKQGDIIDKAVDNFVKGKSNE